MRLLGILLEANTRAYIEHNIMFDSSKIPIIIIIVRFCEYTHWHIDSFRIFFYVKSFK